MEALSLDCRYTVGGAISWHDEMVRCWTIIWNALFLSFFAHSLICPLMISTGMEYQEDHNTTLIPSIFSGVSTTSVSPFKTSTIATIKVI